MTKNEALRVEIEEGQILLNSVSVLVDQTDVKILEIDSSSKYAEVVAYCSSEDECSVEIYLRANERTLYSNKESDMATTVRVFYGPREFVLWTCIAEWSRYTLFVALFPSIEGKLIWLKEQK